MPCTDYRCPFWIKVSAAGMLKSAGSGIETHDMDLFSVCGLSTRTCFFPSCPSHGR